MKATKCLLSNGMEVGLYIEHSGKRLDNFSLASTTTSFLFSGALSTYGVNEGKEPGRSLSLWSREKRMLPWTGLTGGEKGLESDVLCKQGHEDSLPH